MQAEIDAASFHVYGLSREQTEFILDDFHQAQNPRRMTDEYFDLVLEKYDDLAEQEPWDWRQKPSNGTRFRSATSTEEL